MNNIEQLLQHAIDNHNSLTKAQFKKALKEAKDFELTLDTCFWITMVCEAYGFYTPNDMMECIGSVEI